MQGNLEISGGTNTGTYSGDDRVVETGATRIILDTRSLVVADYFAVEGTGELIIEGDGAIAVL